MSNSTTTAKVMKRLKGLGKLPGVPTGALEAAVALGAAAASASSVPDTSRKSRRRKPRSRANISGRTRGQSDLGGKTLSFETSRTLDGSTQARPFVGRLGRATHAVNFDSTSIPVYTDTAGNFVIGAATAIFGTLRWSPSLSVVLNGGGNAYPFGTSTNVLAGAYMKYRLTQLRAEWVPTRASGFDAAILIGTTSEILSTSTLPSEAQINGMDGNVRGPVWQRFAIPVNFDTDWKHTLQASNNNEAEQREEFAGSLCVLKLGSPTVSSLMGYLRFAGRIEFKDLSSGAVFSTNLPAVTQPAPLTRATCARADIEDLPSQPSARACDCWTECKTPPK